MGTPDLGRRSFVVALPRFAERYAYITAHAAERLGPGFELVGVDGREVDPASVEAAGLSPGQVGCALSHVAACRRIAERGLDWGLVVEDDAVLPLHIGPIVEAVAAVLAPDEVVQLYNWPPGVPVFSRRGELPLPGGSWLRYAMGPESMGTTTAYVVGRQAAEGIARVNARAAVPADDWTHLCRMGAVGPMRAAVPSPVGIVPFETTVLPAASGTARGTASRLVRLLPGAARLLALRRQRMIAARDHGAELVDEPSPMAPAPR